MSPVYFRNIHEYSCLSKRFNFIKEAHKALELSPQDIIYTTNNILSESYFEHYNDLKKHLAIASQDVEHFISTENIVIPQKITELVEDKIEMLAQLHSLFSETKRMIDSLQIPTKPDYIDSKLISIEAIPKGNNPENLEVSKLKENFQRLTNKAISTLLEEVYHITMKHEANNLEEFDTLIKDKTKTLETLQLKKSQEKAKQSLFQTTFSSFWGTKTQTEIEIENLRIEINQLKECRLRMNLLTHIKKQIVEKIKLFDQKEKELESINEKIHQHEAQKQILDSRLLDLHVLNMRKQHLHTYANWIKKSAPLFNNKTLIDTLILRLLYNTVKNFI